MSDRLIVLDFDHTIYNTSKFVEAIKLALEPKGISSEDVEENRQKIKDCCNVVDIDSFVEALDHNSPAEIHEIIENVIRDKSKDFVFGDVHDFIKRHQDNFDIMILTQGDFELQSLKIGSSNLPNGIEVVITEGDKSIELKKIVSAYEKVYYIDDKAKHIDEVKTTFPEVITYFIMRPEDKPYSGLKSVCECSDFDIDDLEFTID